MQTGGVRLVIKDISQLISLDGYRCAYLILALTDSSG